MTTFTAKHKSILIIAVIVFFSLFAACDTTTAPTTNDKYSAPAANAYCDEAKWVT
jgi:hypothetical protein